MGPQVSRTGPVPTDVFLEFNEDRARLGQLQGVLQCSTDIFTWESAKEFATAFEVRLWFLKAS